MDPDALDTITSALPALVGSTGLLGLAAAMLLRALPHLARWLDGREQRKLVRAQTRKLNAEAKVTSEAVTQQQLSAFRASLESRLEAAEARATAAEARASAVEARAAEREQEHERIVTGLRNQIADLEKLVEALTPKRSEFDRLGEMVAAGVVATEEHVVKSERDGR